MSETIEIDELVFSVKRSTRRRTVGATVERDKSLVAHLPQGVALDEATRLIASKLLWVHQKLAFYYENFRILDLFHPFAFL